MLRATFLVEESWNNIFLHRFEIYYGVMRGTEQWGMLCEKVSLSNRNKEMSELIFFLANQPL